MSCSAPPGYVTNNRDCDNSDARLTPEDGDGDGHSGCAGDCDDTDASLNLAMMIGTDLTPVRAIVTTVTQR